MTEKNRAVVVTTENFKENVNLQHQSRNLSSILYLKDFISNQSHKLLSTSMKSEECCWNSSYI